MIQPIREALTAEDFAAYGQVVEVPDTGGRLINNGTAWRYDDVAELALDRDGGRPLLSLFRVQPARFPLRCTQLERHPTSSQLFLPLGERPFLVVVALGRDAPDPATLRVFVTNGHQGVNYAPGTWHHPTLALEVETDFLVLGRADTRPGDNCDELPFEGDMVFELT
ncbi:ureidoglycolate lyase [Archangium primigenium]|uniref:ureidoglycolate lyase n=1 Tax=[Archangium] primigenium TaxID=2792470 RepID=UPI0019594FA8|nr:ureidoglycolate lyase [Archangium primigenium]MBM7111957.1 ureidoglycolate lyase [Archangium primigenium]